jgi:hypothetical protein
MMADFHRANAAPPLPLRPFPVQGTGILRNGGAARVEPLEADIRVVLVSAKARGVDSSTVIQHLWPVVGTVRVTSKGLQEPDLQPARRLKGSRSWVRIVCGRGLQLTGGREGLSR